MTEEEAQQIRQLIREEANRLVGIQAADGAHHERPR